MRSNSEVLDILNECLQNLEDRRRQYAYYLQKYYDNVCENLLKKYIGIVISLIYSSKNVVFDYYKDDEEEPLNDLEKKFRSVIQDRFNTDKIGLRLYAELERALIFGNQFLKIYPTAKKVEIETVYPHEIGVRYTTIPEMDDPAQAVCHIKYVPYDILKKQYPEDLINSALVTEKELGLLDDILEKPLTLYGSTQGFFYSPLGENELMKIMDQHGTSKLVKVYELWVWEDDIIDKSSVLEEKRISDYYMYTIINDTVVNKGLNPCVAGRLPFVNICLSPMSKNFWGMSDLFYLLYLQEMVNKNQKRGDKVMDLLSDPPVILSGITTSEIAEENKQKLKQPGSVINIPGEDIKMEEHLPKLDPRIAYEVKNLYERAFIGVSGLNDVLMGEAPKNVRSAGQHHMLANFASAPLVSKALNLESAIEEIMLLYAQSYQIIHFNKYGMLDNYRIKINSHSASPIAQSQDMGMIFELAKMGMIPPTLLIELLPVPRKNDILVYLREKEAMQAQIIREHPEILEKQMEAQIKAAARHGKKK